jgi:hypothetical protein
MNREPGLNLPNVMTPGAWIIVAIVAAAVLAGIGYALYRAWDSRVRWVPLGFAGAQYFAEDFNFKPRFLNAALNFAIGCLIENSKWPQAVTASALQNFKVYVHADDKYAGKPGISGYQSGDVIGVNRKLTTLCHELGHLLQERIDHLIDYEHVKFKSDGIDNADREFSDWLHKQEGQ